MFLQSAGWHWWSECPEGTLWSVDSSHWLSRPTHSSIAAKAMVQGVVRATHTLRHLRPVYQQLRGWADGYKYCSESATHQSSRAILPYTLPPGKNHQKFNVSCYSLNVWHVYCAFFCHEKTRKLHNFVFGHCNLLNVTGYDKIMKLCSSSVNMKWDSLWKSNILKISVHSYYFVF